MSSGRKAMNDVSAERPIQRTLSTNGQLATAPFAMDPQVEQNIRERVHEILVLMHRPAPGYERRRDRRYPYPHRVHLTPVNADGQLDTENTIVVIGNSLSEGGFGFYHAQPLADRRVVVSFHTGSERWVGLLMDLRWCRFAQGWYESGGRFLQPVQ